MKAFARAFQAAAQLFLHPLRATAVVGLVLCVPLLVIGQISDDNARERARQERLQLAASVAAAGSAAITGQLDALSINMAQLVSGELRRGLRERNADLIWRLLPDSGNATLGFKTARARVTDAQGTVLVQSYSPYNQNPNSAQVGQVDERARVAAQRSNLTQVRTERFVFAADRQVIDGATEARFGIAWTVRDALDPGDGAFRHPLLGVVVLDLPLDFMSYALAPLRRSAADVYLVDDKGSLVAHAGEPLAGDALLMDLSSSDLFGQLRHVLPSGVAASEPVVEGERVDPVTGARRLFATAPLRSIRTGISLLSRAWTQHRRSTRTSRSSCWCEYSSCC